MAAENQEAEVIAEPDSTGGDFSITFKVEIDMTKYARRFGVDIPDDTIDADLTDDRPGEETTDAPSSEPVSAEDADVTYSGTPPAGAANCQATLSKCQAKNPLTCRYHGAKAIAQDIEAQIRAQNVPGKVSVEILGVNRQGILTAQVTVKGPASEKKSILAGLKSFAQLPGVESADIFQRGGGGYEEMFDIDTLDPQAQARWGQGQQPPPASQTSSTPPPAVQMPATASPSQPSPTKPAQPSPSQVSSVPPPPAPTLSKSKQKAAKGPKHPVAPPTDGSPSEEQKRREEIVMGEQKAQTATGADKKKLEDALKKMKDASDEMAAFEGSIEALDASLKNAGDKDIQDALKSYLEEAEKAYGDLDREFSKNAKIVSAWKAPDSGDVSKDSIADTIAAIKASGGKVHPYLDNWQATIDSKLRAAKNHLQAKHGLSAAELAAAEGIWKKNCKAVYDGLVSGELTAATLIGKDATILRMLDGKRPVGADGSINGRYYEIATGSFGATKNVSEAEGSLCFTRIMSDGVNDFENWWGGNFAVALRPQKSVLAFYGELYDGARKYGSSAVGNLSLLTDASLVSATGEYVTRAALTKDLSGVPKSRLLKEMGLEDRVYTRGNECHPVGGIHPENCLAIRQMNSSHAFPRFSAAQKATIKKFGIKLYSYDGKEVDVDMLP